MESVNVDEVFGIVRDIPLNYIPRESVDLKLVESLSRTKHIVIHGGSKQGKTCLRKYCLDDDDYIVVQCSNKWTIADVNAKILKQAGFEITQSSEKTISGRHKVSVQAGAKILGIGAEGGGETEQTNESKKVTAPISLDPEDANDLIHALSSINFTKFVVLEDFHYLSTECQRDFAIELKALHEISDLSVIVVGVWLEQNRLIVYNGDLTGRIAPVDADAWDIEELKSVAQKGAELLNIEFAQDFVDELVSSCFSSVAIVQECCRRACREAGVTSKQTERVTVSFDGDIKELIRDVVSDQDGRYRAFISNFADGFQDTRLEMYRWLLWPVLNSSPEDLERGLRYAQIRKSLMSHHPEGAGLNPGNITQALKSCASLQVQRDVKPIILDYDATNQRLSIVDRGFLIWLASQDRSDLLDLAGLPQD